MPVVQEHRNQIELEERERMTISIARGSYQGVILAGIAMIFSGGIALPGVLAGALLGGAYELWRDSR